MVDGKIARLIGKNISNNSVYQKQLLAMGTRMDLVLPGVPDDLGGTLCSAIACLTEEVEQSLSLYRQESSVSQLNRALEKAGSPTVEDKILFSAIELSLDYYKPTKGYFDIAYGGNGDLSRISLDKKNRRIEVDEPGVRFDFGGLGKGITLDKINAFLKSVGVHQALISFGESSILAMGSHPQGDYWPLGISHPNNRKEFLHTFRLVDAVLTVSSTLTNGGDGTATLNPHIVNPHSKQLVNEAKVVAVVTDSAAKGEIFSTCLLVASEREQREISRHGDISEAVSVGFRENGLASDNSWQKVSIK